MLAAVPLAAVPLAPVDRRELGSGPGEFTYDLRYQGGRSTVRGQLYRVDQRGQRYPAPGIPVRLNHPQYGPSQHVYTDNAGMYYLQGIAAGVYTLEVLLSKDHVLRFQIQVYGDRPFTDIAPIPVP